MKTRTFRALAPAAGAVLTIAYLGLTPAVVKADVPSSCVGDCNGDGAVTVDELIVGVNMALGARPVSDCPVMDANGDGQVSISDLIAAVRAALDGCPATPTETATSMAADTPTSTAIDTATPTPTDTPIPTATATTIPTTGGHFCDLPGSVQTTMPGISVVPGGPPGAPDLSYLQLPIGFCAHYYGHVGNTRQLRFAPGGELFVASPTTNTTGGGQGGQAAILVLPDDDHDGTADSVHVFLGGNASQHPLQSTQGLLFANGYLYYQDATKIMRLPYQSGDRTPSAASQVFADLSTQYTSILHWPKTLDMADDGTIYVGNGGDEGEACDPRRPFHGGILKLDGTPGGNPIARGFRNTISIRCAQGHNMCFAIELTRDFSTTNTLHGREKVLQIREGTDWGFPCCATKDTPFGDIRPQPDCSMVEAEVGAFFVGDTPFDLDFESGKWPEPWDHQVYIPLHGAYGSWVGARIVAIDFNAMTGQVLPGSDILNGSAMGPSSGAMKDFATGWVPAHTHGRPANVVFAPDGRLFLGNDVTGDIIWIAPLGL